MDQDIKEAKEKLAKSQEGQRNLLLFNQQTAKLKLEQRYQGALKNGNLDLQDRIIREKEDLEKRFKEEKEALEKKFEEEKEALERAMRNEVDSLIKIFAKGREASGRSFEKVMQVLELHITPGTAPPEEIALYLSKLSRLYKSMGGSGLEFRPSGVEVNEREGAQL